MPTTYLITGANRGELANCGFKARLLTPCLGLGRGLVEAYLSRPDNVVVAAVRDPTHSTSKSLYDLPKGSSSSIVVVKIESASETDPAEAISELRRTHDITAIDVVVANAGIVKGFMRVEDASTADLLEHYHVNAIGAVILFRAVLPLLRNSQKTAKFIAMGTGAASIGEQEKAPVPNAVYGPSKAALNWFIKKIHLENEELVAFPIHPGFVLQRCKWGTQVLTDVFCLDLYRQRWEIVAPGFLEWEKPPSRSRKALMLW